MIEGDDRPSVSLLRRPLVVSPPIIAAAKEFSNILIKDVAQIRRQAVTEKWQGSAMSPRLAARGESPARHRDD
jgi:hypothetical protein